MEQTTNKNNAPLILIVDDDANFREIWKTKLISSGFQVIEAENGKKALDILNTTEPNVILLDIVMPELDGVETFFAIKENPKTQNIKIFFITSMDDLNEELAKYHKKIAGELGAVDYLRKATDLNDLVNILRSVTTPLPFK
jgi:CheY-like chemotaxis protein